LRFALTILFTLAFAFGKSQDWELKKSADGIQVFTKPITGSAFKAFKAQMELHATVAQIEYILKNADKFKAVFPDTEELEILDRPNENSLIQYNRTDAPWPVSDRDGVYQNDFSKTPEGGLKVVGYVLQNYKPEVEDVVRMKKSDVTWLATPLNSGMIKLEYIVAADPGGKLPEWLVNSAVTEMPFETFENIRKAIEQL